jgi:glycosyltransferase involved in cell wall biosynthesis
MQAMRRLGIDARKLSDYGIGTYLQGLLGELVHLDPASEVVLLVAREHLDLLPKLPEPWRIVEVDAPGYSVREQITVLTASVRARVGVLHVPHYVVPVLFPGRLIVTIHDIIHVLFPEFLPHPLAFAYARWAIRLAVKRARRLIAVSAATAHDLERLFGASGARLHVIPSGVSPTYLAPGDHVADAELRRKLDLPERYLLHVGNHKPHKNAEGLLKAYQLLVQAERIDAPPLVMVGGFSREGRLAKRACAMGLEDRVRCVGYVEQAELAAIYRGASAFVYPTLYEGFGLTVLEAMACGVPVIAGEVPAIREVAGDAIMRVNPRDLVELAAAIRRVLIQKDLQQQMRERGQARAREFQWRRAAEATLSVYRSVMTEA